MPRFYIVAQSGHKARALYTTADTRENGLLLNVARVRMSRRSIRRRMTPLIFFMSPSMVLRSWLQLRNLNVGRELAPDSPSPRSFKSGVSSLPTTW